MTMFDFPHCGDRHHVNDFCATGPLAAHPAPEQVAEASGRYWRVGAYGRRIEDHALVRAGEVHQVIEMYRGGYLGFGGRVGGEWNPAGWELVDGPATPSAQADRAEAQDAAVGELLERLGAGQQVLAWSGGSAPEPSHDDFMPYNPDGPEAASVIRSLQADVETLDRDIDAISKQAWDADARAERAEAERDALRKALEQWDCGSCNDGVYLNRTRAGDEVVTCKVCNGTGQHPIARAALAMQGEGS